jgi:protein phosphatase
MSRTATKRSEGATEEFVRFDDVVSQFFERQPNVSVKADIAAESHAGFVRSNNEDHYLAVKRYRGRDVLLTSLPRESLPNNEDYAYTLAVADGMGGRDFGELAAFLALKTGWVLGEAEIKWAVRVNDRESDELRRKAQVFFRLIHKVLKEMARQNPQMTGMGTTLTLAYSTGPELFVLHAGDSRAYLHRDGKLLRLTKDHTMAQLLIDSGMAEPGSELARKTKRVLTNALGAGDLSVEVDFVQQTLADGDRVLLCTDGLTDLVDEAEILKLMEHNPKPKLAAAALVKAALDRGGRDNVTVVVGHYSIEPEERVASGLTEILMPVLKGESKKR